MSALAPFIALALAVQAHAPSETDSWKPAYVRMPDSQDSPEVQWYRFLDCAANRRKVLVRKIVDSRDPKEIERAQKALDDIPGCELSADVGVARVVSLGSSSATLRGMIAEIFLKRDGRHVPDAQPLQLTYPRDWYGLTGRARPLDEMAVCVAETNPAGTAALLERPFGSAEQRSALAALAPSFGPCLAAGYELNANALGLRTALAEALYHRVFDAPPIQTDAVPMGGKQ